MKHTDNEFKAVVYYFLTEDNNSVTDIIRLTGLPASYVNASLDKYLAKDNRLYQIARNSKNLEDFLEKCTPKKIDLKDTIERKKGKEIFKTMEEGGGNYTISSHGYIKSCAQSKERKLKLRPHPTLKNDYLIGLTIGGKEIVKLSSMMEKYFPLK